MSLRASLLVLGRAATFACVVGGLVLAGACGGRAPAAMRGDGGAGTTGAGGPVTAADAVRVMTLSHDDVWRRLGPHRFQAKSRLRVTVGNGPPDLLEEEYLLEAGTAGAFHARYQNSHDEGREVVLVGGDLCLRPRYGTFMRRRAEEGEADRLRAETFGGLGAPIEVLGRFVAARPDGRTSLAGREAQRFSLGLAPRPRAAPSTPGPRREWRASVVVQRLSGSLDVDEPTGVPLACTLRAEYTFRHGERAATAELELEGAITPDAQVAVTAPAHVPQPMRSRYHFERQELLKDLQLPGAGQP
jgi:hypothetical protein